MWRRAVLVVGLVLLAGSAGAGDRWFNLQVTDPTEPVEVSMRVPLPLVTSVLDSIHSQRVRSHHVQLDWDFDLADTQALLARVRAVPEGGETRFVQDGADVVVRRHGATLRLEVTEKTGEAVEMELPAALLEVLDLRDNRLDLEPLVHHLESVTGEVLRLKAGETRVRMWVEEL
jgi:hypothetical protein